ncbi:MAG TPA: methionine adenosyltransferase [Thermodesulfobacteriota bacterium]
MKRNIVVRPLTGESPYEEEIEIVERKGIGHPDTICDYVAEEVSNALSKYYLDEFGAIMHHNVDKGLLFGGISNPSYKGGEIVEPIDLTIVGRAIKEKKGKALPIDEIAIQAVRKWLKENIRHLEIENHIITNVKIRPGSRDLIDLFERFREGEVPLSNDTSIGTGFYPLDELEKTVYKVERFLNGVEIKRKYPFIGEDIKIMGVRNEKTIKLTIAMATVDKYVLSLDDYIDKINSVKKLLLEEFSTHNSLEVTINTADNYENERIYLTVTGTSAEHGDDGQVGRGNRVNGLITPYRPMTLEAAAGKNSISHIGKIYNFFANNLSKAIVERGYADEAYVYIASEIGKSINQPQVLVVKVKRGDLHNNAIKIIANEMLDEMPSLWKSVIKGEYQIA